MKKISKKEITHTVEKAMGTALQSLEILEPSKKTKKLLGKVSKKFSGQLKVEVKKLNKKAIEAAKSLHKGTASKKAKSKATKSEQA
ncbi:MAG TPA: hypothetical protein PLJ60_07765 [Chryseolinea sp.]|nr:hypothetical protein [Chryseolinea sp.]HPM30219.1 hypothetical protein [Chryseolinea sp.]